MPNLGRGHFREIAKQLRMHTSLVSQIFSGDRHLNPEQACDLCRFWGLNDLETEMFLALVHKGRAGSKSLGDMLAKQIQQIRQRADKLSYRLPQDKILSAEAQAVFYSNWSYSGIRLLSSIPQYQNIDAIAEYFDLSKQKVAQVLEFLIAHGLCVREKNGKVQMGPQRTHLSAESPLIARHHLNWRTKSFAKVDHLEDHELMFTAPMSISRKDATKIKKRILEVIEELSETVKETQPEKLVSLNIDFLDF